MALMSAAVRFTLAAFLCSEALALSSAISSSKIIRRAVAAGGKCGVATEGAACAAGLCCSAAGICGTGAAFCSAPDCQLSFGPACDGNQVPGGQDTSSLPRPALGSVPYGIDVSHCSIPGKVALTFDDGPYIYTTELLDLLKRNNIKATFFVVGNNGGKGQVETGASGYPAILQRMYADGHQIGSHTWSHQDLANITSQQRHEQIIRNEIALVDVLGFFPTYFRPPYTSCTADCYADLGKLGYHVLNYDVDTKDWRGDYDYARNKFSGILSSHTPSSYSWISLAHDIQPNTVHSFAQYMIDTAIKLGYELVTVGECLGDPVENWYRNPKNGMAWDAGKGSGSSAQAIVSSMASQSTGSSTAKSAQSTTFEVMATPRPAEGNFGAGTGKQTLSAGAELASATRGAAVTGDAAGHKLSMLSFFFGIVVSAYLV